ncbi:universal stress protein [Mucilaginibacter sp. X5P1]|uniref:universal stress protein n=1 Tax=Mucilaginibacter sp. X5P1 TaxID=2723088 RepID=UPI00160BCA3D|nr:universal stress protein [Mucilaginibacter sp. X5P1]MBB6140825.1 nucleotide-binding universal stress UspA family protein [Mucilaginibacter sp. X5P1]
MKKFLFPTDFSANAKHALNYGYSLAKQVKANMIICNAIIEPAEIPQAGLVSWPMEESDLLQDDSNSELKRLKEQMENKEETISFNPSITCISEAGTVTDMINRVGYQNDVGLVIIGTHGSSGLSTLLLGDHSREIIDEINKPLLLVPPVAKIKPVKKIAFATDFKDPVKDMEGIHILITLARPLNAEILITNIFDEDEHAADWLINELANKANYPHIYYRMVKAYHPVSGLDWLCEHGDIDMLAMVHRSHNFIDSLFRGSQTQKMANHIAIPLLVFPAI